MKGKLKHQNTNTIGIIPARFKSSRLPGKPLKQISGKPMIIRVIEQCLKANLEKVIVATDDKNIFDVVSANGYLAVMTPEELTSGTERCFAALEYLNESFDFLVNIQGDEPFISPNQINQVIDILKTNNCDVATLFTKFDNEAEVKSENKVKVVTDENNKALYFSRSVIPYPQKSFDLNHYKKHVGIYGFNTKAIPEIKSLKPNPLEKAESLEQLRWLLNGYQVYTGFTNEIALGIDTPEDLKKAEEYLKSLGQ